MIVAIGIVPYGNENWEFDQYGFMARRTASINDLAIAESERKYFWELGIRPSYRIWGCDYRLLRVFKQGNGYAISLFGIK